MKNKLKITGLFLFLAISLVVIFDCGKITSPGGIGIPENPRIKTIDDNNIEVSWDYDQSDQDVFFTVARKVGC